MNLRAAIVRLRAFGERLKHPHDFYASNAAHWRETAVRLTKATVLALRPQEEMPEMWALKAETLVSRIGYTLLELPAAGLILHLGEKEEDDKKNHVHHLHGQEGRDMTSVSINDLMRFVEEGRKGTMDAAGNLLGKNLDDRDLTANSKGRIPTDKEIAWRMMYAIKKRAMGYDRLLFVLNRFLGEMQKDGSHDLGEAILKAWLSSLVPIVREDWASWLSRRVRSI